MAGELIVAGTPCPSTLANGAEGQVSQIVGGVPTWATLTIATCEDVQDCVGSGMTAANGITYDDATGSFVLSAGTTSGIQGVGTTANPIRENFDSLPLDATMAQTDAIIISSTANPDGARVGADALFNLIDTTSGIQGTGSTATPIRENFDNLPLEAAFSDSDAIVISSTANPDGARVGVQSILQKRDDHPATSIATVANSGVIQNLVNANRIYLTEDTNQVVLGFGADSVQRATLRNFPARCSFADTTYPMNVMTIMPLAVVAVGPTLFAGNTFVAPVAGVYEVGVFAVDGFPAMINAEAGWEVFLFRNGVQEASLANYRNLSNVVYNRTLAPSIARYGAVYLALAAGDAIDSRIFSSFSARVYSGYLQASLIQAT